MAASIIWQLRELGYDADGIETVVEDHGPFKHYVEKKTSLRKDINRVIDEHDKRHPNKRPRSKFPRRLCCGILLHLHPWNGRLLI